MTLERSLACAAPLVFSDPDGENPFFGGTCFRAKFRGGMFVITARHCIENSHIKNLAKTRVECATPEMTYFPLKAWHFLDTVSREDTACGDIAIFEVDLERMTREEKDRIPALDVEVCQLPVELKPGWRLLVDGFPSHLGDMDPDRRQWGRVSEKLEARYEGPSEFQWTSRLSFLNASRAAYLDGFSGAPVFAFDQLGSNTIRSGFAGMMILARYFVNAGMIIRALTKVTEHKRVTVLDVG